MTLMSTIEEFAATPRGRDPRHEDSGRRLVEPFAPGQSLGVVGKAIAWHQELRACEVRFDVRSELGHLQQASHLLADLYARTPLTERQANDLRQAVMEMGGNAIEWGHKKDAMLPLRIACRIDPDAVTLVITDQGPGFNPHEIPHAAKEDDPVGHLDVRSGLGLREGGFGIMLARGLVDEFKYNDKGNEVTLVKRFPRPDAA
jgi:anti-sigma regulatory factor (Ser/Thr protein kinase)